jgi:hypothetical protein
VGRELKLGVKERRDCFESPWCPGVLSKQPGELRPGGRVCRFHDLNVVLRHRPRSISRWQGEAFDELFALDVAPGLRSLDDPLDPHQVCGLAQIDALFAGTR